MIIRGDTNTIRVGSGISSTDGITPIMLMVDPITDYLLVDSATDALTPTSATMNKHDVNGVPTLYGVSSTDGFTLVPIRTDSNGRLLVQNG